MGDQRLATTRRALHAVAELVLAGPQYRATGKLRLRVVPGGFATVLAPELRAIGAGVVGAGGAAVPIDGHTARAIGAELGVAAGRPEGAYNDGAGVDQDETLTLDSRSGRRDHGRARARPRRADRVRPGRDAGAVARALRRGDPGATT